MQELLRILKQYWGYDTFRPLQQDAITCVLQGRDSLVVLPTGGGKSLCFQAPAVAMPGMAVVVSPLISLMQDQVDALRTNGVAAAKIRSGITEAERQSVHRSVQDGSLKLLYVSPERLAQPRFVQYLQNTPISFFVVDEAHCISHWGHDFRPEYRQLRQLRALFPGTAIHGYTATATQHVREDICRELCLQTPSVLVGAFDRPNLNYRVERRSGDGYARVKSIIEAHPGEAGIVYCLRRADVDAFCERLNRDGHKALPYHAGMGDAARRKNQERFTNEQVDIIVATVAFGMGIDKSNVRYVVHAAMPKTIEHYQQEAGRAGRDGLPADCWLFYSYGDFRTWQSILAKNEGEDNEVALAKLRDMQAYCDRPRCRHKALIEYFGQIYEKPSCDACDTCLEEGELLADATAVAGQILRAVDLLGDIAGPSYTTLVLSGSREDRVVAKGHDRLPIHGALSTHAARDIRDWVEQLVQQGYLSKQGEYNILRLTGTGRAFLGGTDGARLSAPASSTRPRKAATARAGALGNPLDKALFELLRQARKAKAEELHVPPFVVFSDATLRDMARQKPATLAALGRVFGIGQRKSEAFGEDFLRVVLDFCAEHPEAVPTEGEEDEPEYPSERPRRGRSGRYRRS